MRQWRDVDGAVFGSCAQAFREPQQGADHALRSLIEGEALQPCLIIEPALDQHLQQRDPEFGLAFGLFLDLPAGPRHQGHIVERHGPFGILCCSEQ